MTLSGTRGFKILVDENPSESSRFRGRIPPFMRADELPEKGAPSSHQAATAKL